MSSPSPLHRLATQHFDERYKRKQSESFFSQPEHTILVSRHRTLSTQYFYIWVFFFESSIYFLQDTKTFACSKVFHYILLSNTNRVFLFRHLPIEIVIFINVCYQMKHFSGDTSSFFKSRFC